MKREPEFSPKSHLAQWEINSRYLKKSCQFRPLHRPVTLGFLLFFQCSEHMPATGPLHGWSL